MITTFLEDLNPQLLTTINSEFAKVDGQSPPEPVKFSAELQATSGGKGGGVSGSDPMDELVPRTDLEKLVSGSLVADCRSDAWKTRKAALEAILAVVKSNPRLKPSMGLSLPP